MKKPWKLPPGSQGCPGAGRNYQKKRPHRGQGGRLLLALVTLAQAALSLALAVHHRQETLRAVRAPEGGEVRLLLKTSKRTQTPRP